MRRLFRKLLVILVDLRLEAEFRLSLNRHRLVAGPASGIIVSMTSYPARIRNSWIALESLFRQSDKNFHLVLVLAAPQFPGKKLPRMIRKLQKKGLEILWTEVDGRSFDHLWPAYQRYGDCAIISVDDDKFFDSDMVSILRAESRERPGQVIGWRGWCIIPQSGEIAFSDGWIRASRDSPQKSLFMPPGNGSLYPPGSLPDLTGDRELREKLCPNADDVWYWAMTLVHGTKSFCLGMSNHRPIWKQSRTPSLFAINPGPTEFKNVAEFFEIGERFLAGGAG